MARFYGPIGQSPTPDLYPFLPPSAEWRFVAAFAAFSCMAWLFHMRVSVARVVSVTLFSVCCLSSSISLFPSSAASCRRSASALQCASSSSLSSSLSSSSSYRQPPNMAGEAVKKLIADNLVRQSAQESRKERKERREKQAIAG